ncbi:DUF1707 domain-containing protein [Amycolatopsis roodepoortensis]|uniref:TM2 domain-containing membrane protein YozV n=1 Tax=Amycolatopsis roodepoortensis TaxID=700274 RepID=A0ABR9L024_9PSEU|nr:DUF1707 domain-containing protein [Amycolatopsis roodepoortensis]MBE1573970.1 TM2 domain-containing membrane protein YozV [Amycolatopsis roodepoortensis]
MSQQPDPDEMRVGTAEREEAARLLADHYSQGRITPDEYEGRVLAAYEAVTLGELRPLFQDLPAPHPKALAPRFDPPPFVPVYQQPAAVAPYSPKSKIAAGVLQIVLPFGIGRFYTGHVGLAIGQLAVVLVTCGVGAVWPIVDGIVLLANGGTDAQGRRLRD